MVNTFVEARMPSAISQGAQGGPEFLTRIVTTGGGVEYRNAQWSEARGSWNVGYGVKDNTEWAEIYAFFMYMKGKNYGFRFRDQSDHTATNSYFGTGDGTTTLYKLYKSYEIEDLDSNTLRSLRRITKPAPDYDFTVYVNGSPLIEGTNFDVDYERGEVTFNSAPANGAILTWTGYYDNPARFDVDKLDAALPEFNNHEWPDVPVVELHPDEVAPD